MAVFAIDFSLEATTSDEFCVSCHEMREHIQEADSERLYLASSGELHGSCADCHLPKPFVPRLRRKLRASAEIYHHFLGSLDTPEAFDARRMQMARRVWAEMNHNDSVECRSCHSDLSESHDTARAFHDRAEAEGVGCIDCHKGLAHRVAPRSSAGERDFEPEGCFSCHAREDVLATPRETHAKIADLASPEAHAECARCHGVGQAHTEFPMLTRQGGFGEFADDVAIIQQAACVECHARDEGPGWQLVAHGFSEPQCVSCHSIHRPTDAVMLRGLRERSCAEGCHSAIASAEERGPDGSGGEVRTCTSCHDPHSPGAGERCAACHPQGPDDLARETPEARAFHQRGLAEGIQCRQCHKGLLHQIPHSQLSERRPEYRIDPATL